MVDFTEKLKSDLLSQFVGKPNLNAIMNAFGNQLSDVYQFYSQLQTMRSVTTAIGQQLDGIGDIVDLSRLEAGALSTLTNMENVGNILDDENFRTFLFYKIWKNTNVCTYPDIIKSFQMFWDLPLYYSESPDEPATMILSSDILMPEDNAYKLLTAPIIKAAGVKLIIRTITVADLSELTVVPYLNSAIISKVELPEILPEHDFEKDLYVGGLFTSIQSSAVVEVLPEHKFEQTITTEVATGFISETDLEEIVPTHAFNIGESISLTATGISETAIPEVISVPNLTETKSFEFVAKDVGETLLTEVEHQHSFVTTVRHQTSAFVVVESKIPNYEQLAFSFMADSIPEIQTTKIINTKLKEDKEQ